MIPHLKQMQVYWEERARRKRQWIPTSSVRPTKGSKRVTQILQACTRSHLPRRGSAAHAFTRLRPLSPSGMPPTCLAEVGLTSSIHTRLFVFVEVVRTDCIHGIYRPHETIWPHMGPMPGRCSQCGDMNIRIMVLCRKSGRVFSRMQGVILLGTVKAGCDSTCSSWKCM